MLRGCSLALVFVATICSSAVAVARPCAPCADSMCVGDAEANQAFQDKRASLLASGAPVRLVDQLMSKVERCVYCLSQAPDALHIQIVISDSKWFSFSYSRFDERLARKELKTGKIKSFRIFWARDRCTCCQSKERPETATEQTYDLDEDETLTYDNPQTLGPDPEDLKDNQTIREPKFETPNDPPHPGIAHGACSECVALSDQRNQIADDLWEAQRKYNRLSAERDWVERLASLRWARAHRDLSDDDIPPDMKQQLADDQLRVQDPMHVLDRAKADVDRLTKELAKADAALLACNQNCGKVRLTKTATGFRPQGSVSGQLGGTFAFNDHMDHQLAFGFLAMMRVLPRNLPGFVVFAPSVGVLNNSVTVYIPFGFQYDFKLPVPGLIAYARFELGYAGQFITFGPASISKHSALIAPEGGLRYEFAKIPLLVGADLVSIPILLNPDYVTASYRVMFYAGFIFGR